jgi:hypothetical protein
MPVDAVFSADAVLSDGYQRRQLSGMTQTVRMGAST